MYISVLHVLSCMCVCVFVCVLLVVRFCYFIVLCVGVFLLLLLVVWSLDVFFVDVVHRHCVCYC